MSRSVFIRVVGVPKPAGSKRAFALRRNGVLTGKVAVTDDCKTSRPWKSAVSHEAAAAMRATAEAGLLKGAVEMETHFTMPRAKGHFRTGANAHLLRPSAPKFHVIKPDALKLARAAEDALTGIVYQDDAQVVRHVITKSFSAAGEPIGCVINVREL